MRQFRTELAAAVGHLAADPDQALHAIYTSPMDGRFDVENVLLYNVGTAAFGRSAGSELVVEQRMWPIPAPPRPLEGAAHHYAYAIAQRAAAWRAWSVVRQLVSSDSDEIGSMAEAARPASVWFAVRRGHTSIFSGTGDSSRIGLELTVELPPNAHPNLARLTKPLIDGTLTALHAHDDPAAVDLVSRRISARIGVPASDVRSLLSSNEAAILGSRRLVWPWRESVQWNPADDRCVAFRIQRVDREETDRIGGVRIRGSVFEIEPSPPEAEPRLV